jgi:hypothetical protein
MEGLVMIRSNSGVRKNASSILLSLLAIAIFGAALSGCGSSMQMMNPPPPAANTQVALLLTSTANDQLVRFDIFISSIALTNNAGKSITVFTSANQSGTQVEWMHLNGASEPLPTVSLPQGIYTSATVTVADCSFTNVTFVNSSITTSIFDEGLCGQGTGTTTVNFPSPITVAGSAMALSLDLQVSQSFTLTSASPAIYTISPTFNLTPVSIAAQPTDETNGKVIGVAGQVMSLDMNGNSFTAQTPDGFLLTLSTNANTTFQGIAAFSSLATNQLAYFDAAIQPDGSLLATRVEVDDPTSTGAIIGFFSDPQPRSGFVTLNLQLDGCSISGTPFCGVVYQFDNTTVFNISQQLSNVASLPFPASFGGTTLLLGQYLSVFTPGTFTQNLENVSTITLELQTLNGTVTGVSNEAGFTVYTVTLAPYDLIPVLQNLTSDTPPPNLMNPLTVLVYADSNTRMLNSGAVAAGSLIRFRGLIFDDNATLRMDASEIYDGVTE